jgi:hypothetical protein
LDKCLFNNTPKLLLTVLWISKAKEEKIWNFLLPNVFGSLYWLFIVQLNCFYLHIVNVYYLPFGKTDLAIKILNYCANCVLIKFISPFSFERGRES